MKPLSTTSFDSILVRLKDINPSPLIEKSIRGFDSILVRLKGLKIGSAGRGVILFRFHTGSIKSPQWWSIKAQANISVSIPYWFD